MKSFFEELSELVDIIKGSDINHIHLKENIVVLKDLSFITKLSSEIQRGDTIYIDNRKIEVTDFKKFDDYILFKTYFK